MSLDFLRKYSFYFLRDDPVDLKRYLPQYLNNDPLFSDLQDALSIEHERYRLGLVELSKQFYIETTSDFERWEQFLKISPAAGASDELRRSVIRAKRRGGTVMTVENTKRLLADFAPRGEVDIRELGANKLELIIRDGTFWWDELMDALMEQLPAHLTFDFEISRTLNHSLYVGQLTLEQGKILYDQPNRFTHRQPLQIVQSTLTAGRQRTDIAGKKIVVNAKQGLHAGFAQLIHGKIRYDAELSEPDDYTIEDFERYIRQMWEKFKQNPVVEHYKHNQHGEDPFAPDTDDEEDFPPIDKDFLRLWWKFWVPNKRGELSMRLRTTTILDPREDITAGEIKSLGLVGAAGEIFVWRNKDRTPTSGLYHAALVHQRKMKII